MRRNTAEHLAYKRNLQILALSGTVVDIIQTGIGAPAAMPAPDSDL